MLPSLSSVVVSRLEKAAVDNGFDRTLGTDGAWLAYASTQNNTTGSCRESRQGEAGHRIVKRKDEAKFNGDDRTKRVILEIYVALAEAMRTGHPYQTRLDPPPADARCCHPPRGEK